MKPLLKFLAIGACILPLNACETMEGLQQDITNIKFADFTTAASVSEDPQSAYLIDGNCPQVQIVEDLSRLHEFNVGQSMTSSNLVSSVTVNETQSTCEYNDRSVTMDLKLAFNGQLGPKGRSASKTNASFSYPFFVAITNANGKILAKEIFAASIAYSAGEQEKTYFETLRQIIPADNRAQGARYKVMIGFQLAEQQLAYNRKLLAAEQLAAQKLEMERIAAKEAAEKLAVEKAAAMQADAEIKETMKAPVIIKTETTQVTTTTAPAAAPIVQSETTTITAPQTERAGPFDIFKTNN